MGLLAVPRLKQGGAAAGLGKNAKNKIGGQSWERGGQGEDDDDEGDEGEEGEGGGHPQFGGAAAGSEDEEEDEGEEDEEEDEEDEDGELVLRPKTRKGTPRDRLVRLLERSKAEKRSGPGGKKPAAAAAAAGAAGGSTARCFVSCVVRLSPEKEPMRFVELCEVRPYTAQTKNKLAPWQVLHLLVSGCDSGPSSRVTLSDTCSPCTHTPGARRRAPRRARPHSAALRRRL